jgi:carbamoyl-phosphate synthase large subunit
MSAPLRILVTAVGGDFGQALVKALRLGRPAIACHGCDMDGRGIGAAFVDSFQEVPRSDDPRYADELARLASSLGVDAVVPGSEPEIATLSRLGEPPRVAGIPVVCQPARWLDTYGDKLVCMQALSGRVPLAAFADGSNADAVARLAAEAGFPLIVKPRRSSGSRHVRMAHDRSELDRALRSMPRPFVQAAIDESGGEFSIGVFQGGGFFSAIAFRRELGPVGCSWYAETSTDPAVLEYGAAVAQAAGVRGSANIQVRKSAQGVRLLEINPRFSSLVAARALCGFRDLEWSIDAALGRRTIPPGEPFKQIRFRRFFHELIDVGEGFGRMGEWDPAFAQRLAEHRA